MSTTTKRRAIIAEYLGNPDGLLVHVDDIDAGGLVVNVPSAAEAETDADAALRRLKDGINALEPVIGWRAMDRLLTAVNEAVDAIREEAVARLITAAVQTLDYSVGVLMPPEGGTHRRSEAREVEETAS